MKKELKIYRVKCERIDDSLKPTGEIRYEDVPEFLLPEELKDVDLPDGLKAVFLIMKRDRTIRPGETWAYDIEEEKEETK